MMKNGSRRIPAERKRSPASTGEPDMDNASVGIYIQIKNIQIKHIQIKHIQIKNIQIKNIQIKNQI